jgi:hypothetical protein
VTAASCRTRSTRVAPRRRDRAHAISHLGRPQAEKERGQHTDRGLIALVRLADAHVDEPACLVDPQLLLAPVALTKPYQGDPIDDLYQLRKRCEEALELDLDFDVSSPGSKAISVQGQALECKVDIVPSNWCDTHQCRFSKDKIFRGVKVLDVREIEEKRFFLFA